MITNVILGAEYSVIRYTNYTTYKYVPEDEFYEGICALLPMKVQYYMHDYDNHHVI